MNAIAKYNKIRMSPRKARLVADKVRGANAFDAIETLKHIPNKAAGYIIKVLKSAIANLESKHGEKEKFVKSTVYIQEIYVNQGRVLKRIQPVSKGRAHPIRKPSAHITVKIGFKKTHATKESTAIPTPASDSSNKEKKELPKKITSSDTTKKETTAAVKAVPKRTSAKEMSSKTTATKNTIPKKAVTSKTSEKKSKTTPKK